MRIIVASIVEVVGDTPVIAAGGIADGRGMAAAGARRGRRLGWYAVSRLEEVSIHPEYQRLILAASENDTAAITKSVRWRLAQCAPSRPAQLDRSQLGGRGPAARGSAAARRGDRGEIGDARRCRPLYQHHAGTGYGWRIEPLSLWAGQGAALVRKVLPAAEIVREMNDEAHAILRRLGQGCAAR